MWKWFAIAAGLGAVALAAVLVMRGQDSGNWGDAADHLPSGSTSRLENSALSTPLAETTGDAEESARALPSTSPAETAVTPPAPAERKASAPPPSAAVAAPPVPAAPPPAEEPPKPLPSPNVVNVDLAWVREPPEGALTTAAYMVITNEGPKTDRLLSASSPDAKSVAVHASRMRNGVAENVPMPTLELEPGVPVVFEPGGVHLTLEGLRHPLASGRKVTIFLIFEKAGTVQIGVPVGELTPASDRDGAG